jgi:hypothetical protein
VIDLGPTRKSFIHPAHMQFCVSSSSSSSSSNRPVLMSVSLVSNSQPAIATLPYLFSLFFPFLFFFLKYIITLLSFFPPIPTYLYILYIYMLFPNPPSLIFSFFFFLFPSLPAFYLTPSSNLGEGEEKKKKKKKKKGRERHGTKRKGITP